MNGRLLRYSFPIIIFLLMLIVASLFATIGIDPHHDGILLKPAIDVARGQMLFRDTFTQYGALTTILQSFAVKFLGETVLSIHLLTALIYSLIVLLLYFIWLRLLTPFWSFFSTIITILMSPFFVFDFFAWSSVYSLFFQLLGLYFIMLYYEKSKFYFLFLAGAVASLTFWSRQPVGMLLTIALIVSLFIISYFFQKKQIILIIKEYTLLLTGIVIIHFSFFIWLFLNGAFQDFWKQSIKFAFVFAKSRTTLFHIPGSLFPVLASPIWSIFPAVTVILLMKTIFLYKNNFLILNNRNVSLLLILIVSFFSWAQYYPINTIDHFYWASCMMIGVFVYFLLDLLSNTTRIYRVTTVLIFLFAFFNADIYFRLSEGYYKIAKAGYLDVSNISRYKILPKRFYTFEEQYVKTMYPEVLSGLRLPKSTILYYKTLANDINGYLSKYPERGFLNLTPDLIYNLLSNKDYSFHPVKVYWKSIDEILYPDYNKKMVDYIKQYKPIIIKYINSDVPGYKVLRQLDSPYKDEDRGQVFLLIPLN